MLRNLFEKKSKDGGKKSDFPGGDVMDTLETERLIWWLLSSDDSKRIEELAGDYDVAKSTLNIPSPYPKGSAIQLIESVLTVEKITKS